MDLLTDTLAYIGEHQGEFVEAMRTHLALSGLALAIAIILCVPLGILTSRWGARARVILNGIGVLRVVPSIAVLFLLLPYLGLGFTPALVALILLACPPVLINTDAGMRGVDPAALEAGRGLGMGPLRLLREVQIPLALPVMLAGIRSSAIEVIASATLATLIGAGGLGLFIIRGLDLNRRDILLVGAVPVALMAVATELAFSALQRRVSPPAAKTTSAR
jgi:osmoprotectant transport system permease protein